MTGHNWWVLDSVNFTLLVLGLSSLWQRVLDFALAAVSSFVDQHDLAELCSVLGTGLHQLPLGGFLSLANRAWPFWCPWQAWMLSKELPPGQSVNVPIVGVISLQQPGYSLPHPVKFPLCLRGLHSVQDSKEPVCGSPELSFCITLSPLLHCSCLLHHCPLTQGGCQAVLGPSLSWGSRNSLQAESRVVTGVPSCTSLC